MKKLVLLLVSLVSGLMLSGCGTPSNVYEFIIDETYTEFITLGTSADYPPYEWPLEVNGKQTLVGIDIEIAKLIAEKVGKNLKVINKGFDFLLEDLISGRVDFVLAGMNPDEKRSKVVDFSKIYYFAEQIVLIHKNNVNTYPNLASLNQSNVKVGAQLGSVQQNLAESEFPNAVKQYIQALPDLIMQLNQGSIHALIVEKPVATGYQFHYPDLVLVEEAIGNPEEGSAVAVRKGNQALLDMINQVIDELIETKTIEQIVYDAILLNESK